MLIVQHLTGRKGSLDGTGLDRLGQDLYFCRVLGVTYAVQGGWGVSDILVS